MNQKSILESKPAERYQDCSPYLDIEPMLYYPSGSSSPMHVAPTCSTHPPPTHAHKLAELYTVHCTHRENTCQAAEQCLPISMHPFQKLVLYPSLHAQPCRLLVLRPIARPV